MGPARGKNLFVLECTKEADKIKICGYDKSDTEQETVRHYEEVKVDFDKVHAYHTDIIRLLNHATPRGRVSRDVLEQLKTLGRLLYDEIFSLELKRKLAATASEDMILSIDDYLVNIPWELFHDGNSFFCLRFNMGRLVRTRQAVAEMARRSVKLPMRMFILADPQGNLESAYQEGYSIRDRLERLDKVVKVNIKSSSVKAAHVLGSIRDYDILHYAGHADYDTKNPSNSGFLMEDRRLKASDIVSLIGATPLPSLVFSNACKSGHTDAWRVDKDYETEIYGLANAFLLAGVRHYVGTFWDIQDEPSRHFALDFYGALMSGAMIGEAVRKARQTLIETHGQENVIWASYVLYGDPTFPYVDLHLPQGRPRQSAKPDTREHAPAARGSAGASEEVVTIPPEKRRNRMRTVSAVVAGLIVLAAVFIFSSKELARPPQDQGPLTQAAREAKDKRVDELVAALIHNYNERQSAGMQDPQDLRPSGPVRLVFMNIRAQGISDTDKEYILSRVTDTLQSTPGVQVVEREILDRLLHELNLSSSSLADPAAALRVGRILSASLISTGSILREGKQWQINLRMIETETTLIKGALTQSLRTGDKEEVAERLSRELLEKVRSAYPRGEQNKT